LKLRGTQIPKPYEFDSEKNLFLANIEGSQEELKVIFGITALLIAPLGLGPLAFLQRCQPAF